MNKQLHFNKPQLRSMLINAPNEYCIAGRGTGKSEGILAPKFARSYFGTMPRGAGVIVGATYNQLLTRTLPALVAGWEKLGYIMGTHYLIGKKPTDKWIRQWDWKGPYRPPLSYQYFVSWWNGGGAHLVSQDRQGSSNGITIDWIGGDELKLLNPEKLKTELFPANRGIIPAFKDNPYHHGMTFTTDMPVGTAGRWILDMKEKMDEKRVKQILELYKGIYQLKEQHSTAKAPVKKMIDQQVGVFLEEIQDLRNGLLLYHEASTLENIHALGLDYIKQQLRDTTMFQFDTQILNIRPVKIEDGFYPDLIEEYHGYFSNDNSYLEKLDYDFSSIGSINCLRDSDRVDDKPLHIALDYNRRIHPLVVAQDHPTEIRLIKGMHALYPQKLKDVVAAFIEYYKPHKRKLVYYWYDHTAVGDENETRKCDDVINALRKAGWVVMPMYMGKAPNHEAKYRMWGNLLSEKGHYAKRFRANRENCSNMILSMQLTPAEFKLKGFGKNKKAERDPNFPAEEAPHYGDGCDMLVYGMLESGLPYGDEGARGDRIMRHT